VRVRAGAARSAEAGVRRDELRHAGALGRGGGAGTSAREVPLVRASAAGLRAAGAMEDTVGVFSAPGGARSAAGCLAPQAALECRQHYQPLPDKQRLPALDSNDAPALDSQLQSAPPG